MGAIVKNNASDKEPVFASASVIIPCYRCANTIERAVNSVLTQALPPKEILLVDDFSDDDGMVLALLHQIQKKFNGAVSIRVLSLERNSGPGGARNAAWEEATQPYIAFLDADDAWHHEKLKIQYGYMQNNVDVAITGHQHICLHNKSQASPPLGVPKLSYTKIGPLSFLFKNFFPASSVMLRRSIPLRFSTNKHAAEDFLLWQQVLFAGLRAVRINAPLVFYFKALYGADGLSGQLWKMEKGELDNFHSLHQSGKINRILLAAATTFSLLKFAIRIVITLARRSISRSSVKHLTS